MTNQQPSLRFDHREIAVIFSLFVFVSLLMFTVGILVGKGLAQAKYDAAGGGHEARVSHASPPVNESEETTEPSTTAHTSAAVSGTSVSTAVNTAVAENKPAPAGHRDVPDFEEPEAPKSAPAKALTLVPQRPKQNAVNHESLLEPKNDDEATRILKDPKIQALLDDGPSSSTRGLASAGKYPTSFESGKFSVQVGSYPTEKDASERVEQLKKLGFPHAYFSAKELGENKETWYRVWLGYYPDYQSASDSGRLLKDRGEVKNYLVRKSDSPG